MNINVQKIQAILFYVQTLFKIEYQFLAHDEEFCTLGLDFRSREVYKLLTELVITFLKKLDVQKKPECKFATYSDASGKTKRLAV